MITTPMPETNGKAVPVKKAKAARARRKSVARTVSGNAAGMATRYADTATRLLKRGRNAAGGAAQALSGAADYMPDRRRLQRIADENPYLLGAIGLGIGIFVGMMLPAQGRSRRSGSRR